MTDEKDKGAMPEFIESVCPVCKHNKAFPFIEVYGPMSNLWYVKCQDCNWRTCYCDTKEVAVEEFTSRATPSPQKPGEVDLEAITGLLLNDMEECHNYNKTGAVYAVRWLNQRGYLHATGRLNAVPPDDGEVVRALLEQAQSEYRKDSSSCQDVVFSIVEDALKTLRGKRALERIDIEGMRRPLGSEMINFSLQTWRRGYNQCLDDIAARYPALVEGKKA